MDAANDNFDYTQLEGRSDNFYFISETGIYYVFVKNEIGCIIKRSIYMDFIDVEFPSFFTPNGDGENDTWAPSNNEGFPNMITKIYDRYGRQLYIMHYTTPGWEGIYNEVDLPSGDYWYVVKLNGEQDKREFVGHFTLYR